MCVCEYVEYVCVCVCVCVRARACVRACVHACMRACMHVVVSKGPVEETSDGKRMAEHIHRLYEIEFRALRAYLMHYKESGSFDKW